jgi:FkbM family methyltransferase
VRPSMTAAPSPHALSPAELAAGPPYRRRVLLQQERALPFLSEEPLTLGDVGARGDLCEPFASLGLATDHLSVVAFEADPGEAARLRETFPERLVVDGALFGHEGEADLYVTRLPQCSSLYRPNLHYLERTFRPERYTHRAVERVVRVKTTTLDAVATRHGVAFDMLKVDTQGAEHAIVCGGRERALPQTFAVSLECWHAPVYEGAPLVFDVMKAMHEAGFVLFRMEKHGDWYRKSRPRPAAELRTPNNVDLLYLRDLDGVAAFASAARLFKAAMLAELWGFPGYGLEILEVSATRFPERAADARRLAGWLEENAAHLPADAPGPRVRFPKLG